MIVNQYPVDADGNMMSWCAESGHYAPAHWAPNTPTWLTLTLQHYERNTKTAKYVWRDEDGSLWYMFASDLFLTMQHRTITHGVVSGMWHVVKRASTYGLMPYLEEK
jgi:hypothetical protein